MGSDPFTPWYTYGFMYTGGRGEIYVGACSVTVHYCAFFMSWIQIPSWDPPTIINDSDCRLLPPTTQTELEVVTAIQNLGNTVIANAASRSLTKYVVTFLLSKIIR